MYCPGSDKRPWIDGRCRYCGADVSHCSVTISTTFHPHDQLVRNYEAADLPTAAKTEDCARSPSLAAATACP